MTVSVRYIVDDVETAARFYTERLGFERESPAGPGFAMLSRGDLRLLLNQPGAGGAGQAGAEVDGGPRPGGWSRFQLEVTDLDATWRDLSEAGVTARGDVVEGRAGRQVLVLDPSGNPVELFEPAGR